MAKIDKAHKLMKIAYQHMENQSYETAKINYEKAITVLNKLDRKYIEYIGTCYYRIGRCTQKISSDTEISREVSNEINFYYTLALNHCIIAQQEINSPLSGLIFKLKYEISKLPDINGFSDISGLELDNLSLSNVDTPQKSIKILNQGIQNLRNTIKDISKELSSKRCSIMGLEKLLKEAHEICREGKDRGSNRAMIRGALWSIKYKKKLDYVDKLRKMIPVIELEIRSLEMEKKGIIHDTTKQFPIEDICVKINESIGLISESEEIFDQFGESDKEIEILQYEIEARLKDGDIDMNVLPLELRHEVESVIETIDCN